eukprot:TRINITY_DN28447_c0_g1_i1.p1 TRINITY_DN28447_c0_g1~~TRINITY_DN28447_c0_g1_i1.p1  ORF type:complete len:454 (+),score=71.81 TRINITY_DN28447_c0_g1_i1:183-1544(+)
METQREKLKSAFSELDTNGNGSLCFDEFCFLLQRGDPHFSEEKAQVLFRTADSDLSGTIEFNEFVDYIFGHKDIYGDLLASVGPGEDEARAIVKGKSLVVRTAASKAVKDAGQDWKDLTWIERLEAVRKAEGCIEEIPAPKSPVAQKRSSISEKSQAELVASAFTGYDLDFVGNDKRAKAELADFRQSLSTVGPPWDVVEVKEFVAKGTAGWVFLAERKTTGKIIAMKVMRLTQALSGTKEWYMSKALRQINVTNVVRTDEEVHCLSRDKAPPIIAEQLRDAGPVNHYMCLFQEFLNGGTLESLAASGRLSPKLLFKALEDVACTLAKMHSYHLHHKDIKPENILLSMDGSTLLAAKLADFGRGEIGNNPANRADDIRRFGVMLFSLATGEGWTKNRLIHEKHDRLVERMAEAVKDAPAALRELPEVLKLILSGTLTMADVASLMTELKAEVG